MEIVYYGKNAVFLVEDTHFRILVGVELSPPPDRQPPDHTLQGIPTRRKSRNS